MNWRITSLADMPSYDAIDLLRRALRVRPGETPSEAQLRPVVRILCEDAHRRDLQGEQLVIWVKQLWRKLPEAQPESFDRPRGALLQRLISMCIEEFYMPARPHNSSPEAGERLNEHPPHARG